MVETDRGGGGGWMLISSSVSICRFGPVLLGSRDKEKKTEEKNNSTHRDLQDVV